MSDYTCDSPVYAYSCEAYEEDALYEIFKKAFDSISLTKEFFANKKVLLKPNLVLAKSPDHAATTHPAFARAAARLSLDMGASEVILADSPGGPFNEANLSVVYNVCGMKNAAADGFFRLNTDFSFSRADISGKMLKSVNIISAFQKADVVIDLCRLKTHNLTGMSCAVKNLFGLIPGVEKFEIHSTFPQISDFSEMLVDLAEYAVRTKPFIAICDAVVAMEGNGPSHGEPRKTGLLLVSRSPFSLDIVGERIIYGSSASKPQVKYLDAAARRGIIPRNIENIRLIGDIKLPDETFELPGDYDGKFLRNLPNLMGGKFAKLFGSKPAVNIKKCVGCGRCVESCPKKTIVVAEKHGRKRAVIDRKDCIRCFCCGELCPIGAIDTKQNLLIKLIH